MRLRLLALPLLALGCLPPDARAQLVTLETKDLELLYFSPSQSYLAPHVARCFENSMGLQRRLFQYEPSEKVTVLLNDFSDNGNAGAGVLPRNHLMVQIAPVSFAYETIPANESMNWTMNHELVHIAANDQAAGSDRFFRGLFRGKVTPDADAPGSILYFYLTTPRASAPRWYHEGTAVFVETWAAGGLGRAQGAYDEMVFRSMVRDGSRFYDPLGLVSEGTKVDFQVEANSYLYGTRFMSYLAYNYSPESLIRWVSRREGSKAYYSSQFNKVFGRSLDQAWQDWVASEHQFQKANLDAIRLYPTTPFKDLSPQALGSVSRAHFDPDRRKLYAAFNYPGIVAHVGAISLEDGSVQKIRDVKQPAIYSVTSLAYDPQDKVLFYTADNYAYRDLVALDPETKKARVLLKDARIGELVFNRADRSLWGVRTFNGICTLVRLAAPYKEWKLVYSWPYGEVAYDMDISADGRLLSASVGEINGRHYLRVMKIESLLAGDPTPTAQTDFGTSIPLNFVFSPDARYLYGSSYYTGVSNIFRYEPATGALEAVSNAETGFFRPLPVGGDTLIVFRYTGEGFVPATIEAKPLADVSPITFLGQQIAEKYPVVKEWKVGSPAAIPLDSMITRKGRYGSLRSMRLESVYPVVQGYKDFAAYGVRLNFSDPASISRANLTLAYTPNGDLDSKERPHVRAEFHRHDWSGGFQINGADFYDLFGPTKTSLKGYAVGVGYHRTLVYDKPRQLDLNVDVTYYGGLDRLPDYQNVESNFTNELAVRARLSYSNVRHSLGHVEEEKGHEWDVVFDGDRVKGQNFPKVYGDFNLGFALPLKHSSVWLRTAAGYSPGARDEPFANFYFGAFGNNWVDHREVKRYHDWYSFPGLQLQEVGGTNFARALMEWNIPPIRFREVGRPGLYLTWARPSLFATALATNMDSSVRQLVTDVGAQLDFRFTALARLDMTLSLGYAFAFEEGVRPRTEYMVSLKVLQ